MMAAYTMADLERLAALGSGTSQHQIDSGTSQQLPPRKDIRRDVYTVVIMAAQPVRRAEIAALLGLRKTPWLVATIEQLVDAGYLDKLIDEREGQLPVFYYRIRS